jgi:hypothetical protein
MNSRVLVIRVYIHCLIAEMVAPNCNRLGLSGSGSNFSCAIGAGKGTMHVVTHGISVCCDQFVKNFRWDNSSKNIHQVGRAHH